MIIMQILNNEELIITKDQLANVFHSGCKNKQEFKIGIEFEKLAVDSANFKAVGYSAKNGITEFLKRFNEQNNWNYIKESEHIIGLQNEIGSITLEPGSQFEISLIPNNSIHEIRNQLDKYNSQTSKLAKELGFLWLGYGVQPVSTFENIELIPKKRYKFMTNYLPKVGSKALVMMRESAGMQVSLDYESEEDCIGKLRTSLALSPIVSAIFANSPIRNNRYSGYKSYRAYSWLHTDPARCGFVSPKLFDKHYQFDFEDYVDVILDLPMIFIARENKIIKINNYTFRKYLNEGYEGYKATAKDWETHMSLFFPDVRLKNFIEVRNCDCQNNDLIPALPALWKGVLYNEQAQDAAFELVKSFSWEELNELKDLTPKQGLQTTIKNIKVADLANELAGIAINSLDKQAKETCIQSESKYLYPIKKLLKNEQSPADIIIDKWHGIWNKDITKLIEHTQIN